MQSTIHSWPKASSWSSTRQPRDSQQRLQPVGVVVERRARRATTLAHTIGPHTCTWIGTRPSGAGSNAGSSPGARRVAQRAVEVVGPPVVVALERVAALVAPARRGGRGAGRCSRSRGSSPSWSRTSTIGTPPISHRNRLPGSAQRGRVGDVVPRRCAGSPACSRLKIAGSVYHDDGTVWPASIASSSSLTPGPPMAVRRHQNTASARRYRSLDSWLPSSRGPRVPAFGDRQAAR